MVVGFNHNFRYKGDVYHIQTEDSGLASPNIVTLLYRGGTILASKKTSYADIAKIDNLEQVVEELMKEQHKNMLRSLKAGEFDGVIERFKAGKQVTPEVSEGEKVRAPLVAEAIDAPQDPEPLEKPEATAPEPVREPPSPAASKPEPSPAPSTVEASLDEVILSYLMGDD